MEFIEAQKAEFPDLAGYYEELGGLFERKLWHQLSVALERFVTTPGTNRGTNFRSIYTDFISKFDSRLSQVRLALIISTLGHSFADPAEALALFQHVLKSQGKLGPEATMCLEMDVVLVSLKLGETERAKELLEGAKAALASLSSSETIVFSKFYKATAEYRKVRMRSQCSTHIYSPHTQPTQPTLTLTLTLSTPALRKSFTKRRSCFWRTPPSRSSRWRKSTFLRPTWR